MLLLFGDEAPTYDQIIAALVPDWFVYHPMLEPSGTAIADTSGHSYNGTWSGTPQRAAVDGPSVGMGKAPAFSSDDVINWFSSGVGGSAAQLAAGLVAGIFSLNLWVRPNGGTGRFVSIRVTMADTNNRILIYQPNATTISCFYAANGTPKSVDITVEAGKWYNVGMTINKPQDRMRVISNGVQIGSTQTGLGTWAGTPDATLMCWGAEQSSPLGSPWTGAMYRAGLVLRELSVADNGVLSTPI